jgi:hypothetical protein
MQNSFCRISFGPTGLRENILFVIGEFFWDVITQKVSKSARKKNLNMNKNKTQF